VLFIVDGMALAEDHPKLVVEMGADARPPSGCVARELWGGDRNRNGAYMGWEELADHADADGSFRGLR
jgi:hypothetical protein